MTDSLWLAKKTLLAPASLEESSLEKIMTTLRAPYIDNADIFFQSMSHEAWYLEDSAVKGGSYAFAEGVGIRAISEEKTGYAYCEDFNMASMQQAALAVRSIATHHESIYIPIKSNRKIIPYYSTINPLETFTKQQKIELLETLDKQTRKLDSRIIQVNASLAGSHEVVLIYNMAQELTADIRPLVSLHISVIVEDKHGRRESARAGGGGRLGYEYFYQKDKALELAKEAVREALINLEAVAAPAGAMPVVLGCGWPGVLLHEAVGHGLEGDFNRKKLSAFSNRLGQMVAAKGITVVDDGTLKNKRGSITIDDEGTESQRTTLIEDGKLVNYMQDNLNAKLMKMTSTGNCRRESYAHMPMPRMTNTYLLAGNYPPEEIIKSVERGLYAVNFGGGQVDITSGQFVFSASEAYLIERGKITAPVRGATLIGNGPEVMKKISMIGNNLALDPGIGVCGKDGQSIPVGVGQPTLKIDSLTVGGTHN